MSDIFSCHACGRAWGTGPAGTAAHRAACPQYNNFCAKLLDKPSTRATHTYALITVTAEQFKRTTPKLADLMRREQERAMRHELEIRCRYQQSIIATPAYGYALPDADPPRVDPLDVEYDGISLRWLLERDSNLRREAGGWAGKFTPAQRAAVSAHWSAQLRARVAASTAADEAREPSVVVDLEDP